MDDSEVCVIDVDGVDALSDGHHAIHIHKSTSIFPGNQWEKRITENKTNLRNAQKSVEDYWIARE